MSRLVALALAAVSVLPGVSAADPYAGTARTSIDGVMIVGYDDPYAPKAGVIASHVRYYDSRGADMRYFCVAYGTRTVNEKGCVALTPGPVTEGVVVPLSATLRRRVPVRERRGGWIEIDVTATGTGAVGGVPAVLGHSKYRHTVAGVEAVDGGQVLVGPSFVRLASLSGTVRTDRGLRFAPVPHPDSFFPPVVFRIEVLTVTAHADLKAVEASFGRAAAQALPA